MRACEHYIEAEEHLEAADTASDPKREQLHIARAKVHALLAVAGATALQAYSRGGEPELDDWQDAAGGAD